MTDYGSPTEVEIAALFEEAGGVQILGVEHKRYPDELNLIVYVDPFDFTRAVERAEEAQRTLQERHSLTIFLVVRKAPEELAGTAARGNRHGVKSIQDSRVSELVRLISARSRVSSAEPNLVYVADARASLSAVTAARHHLVFGRRGAGKSALLVEARNKVIGEGAVTSWTNIQTLRNESPQRVFLYVVQDVLRALIAGREAVPPQSSAFLTLSEVNERVRQLLVADETSVEDAQRIVPRVQRALADYTELDGRRAYVFIDDFYYVGRDVQPMILDMIHGAVRDARIWLKIASIRHLSNWWQASPPLGLQSGQDADLIDLDVTLQDPERASNFLEGILVEYARRVGIVGLSKIFNRAALDRLVLAAGAVPRDYMVLAVSAIGRALRRDGKQVGVQDVNQAAGDAASLKIQELEEDMAANVGVAAQTLASLTVVRNFCLDDKSYTYFLVNYRDKEQNAVEYARLADLMDVRLIHLVDSGVSDSHEAGVRFEAYMLDLSQFSGSRLKQKINVLDFEDGHFVARQTRGTEGSKAGKTSRELIAILRGAPTFALSSLRHGM